MASVEQRCPSRQCLAAPLLGVLALVALAACASPVTLALQADPTPALAPASVSEARSIRGVAPSPTAIDSIPTRAPELAPDAPPPTPVPPAAGAAGAISTPVPPAMPTLTLPPRRELDPASAAAATANAATAVARFNSAAATAAALPQQEIRMQDLAFAPSTLTVKPGTNIIWRNYDRVPHQVQGGEFDSGPVPSGRHWSSLLEKPGRYAFICSFHPTMRAEITVSPDPSRAEGITS